MSTKRQKSAGTVSGDGQGDGRGGMSTEDRDQFAMAVAAGYVAAYAGETELPEPRWVAEYAYDVADAMIDVRSSTPATGDGKEGKE